MTYAIYALWFLSLLLVAGELDRLFSVRFTQKVMPELSSSSIWFLPPLVSLVLPGSGQFLNNQLIKALAAFTWPIVVGLLPRPWQFLMLKTWYILIPWYFIVALDALVTGVLLHRRQLQEENARAEGHQAQHESLDDFFTRRREARKSNGSQG